MEVLNVVKKKFSVNMDNILINYEHLKNDENDNSLDNEDFSQSIGSEF